MKRTNIPYTYIVRNIGTEKDPAYEAFLPTLNGIVYGDSMQELEEGILGAIKTTLAYRKRKGLPIPIPDRDVKRSGKLVLRIPPALHDRLATQAMMNKMSLNAYIVEKVAI